MLVLVITPEGKASKVEIADTLKAKQDLVGGLIQPLDLTLDTTMWVNEEGILMGLPFNYLATEFASLWYNGVHLFGTAFITGGIDEDGNTMSLKEEYADYFIQQYEEAMA